MVEATLHDADEKALVRARAWRLLRREVSVPDELTSTGEGPAAVAGRPGGGGGAPPRPEEVEPGEVFFPTGHDVGYHTAMEYRFARGGFLDLGPAVAWMRSRIPLVGGEEPTPLQRVLVAADSGNGISATLDFRRYVFINVDLTVHLGRMPVGEWICLDSLTVPEPTGVALTDTMLLDELGPIGRAAQTLMVAER
jgi:hypothetical protein